MPINGKVREWIGDEASIERYTGFRETYGPHFEFLPANMVFDPKYGVYDKIEEYTREHAAYLEDWAITFASFGGSAPTWKTVGWYDQPYADDSVSNQRVKTLEFRLMKMQE